MIGTFPLSASAISNIQIVSILILEHASLSYASSLRPDLDEALDRAYSQYRASNTHDAVIEKFSAPPVIQSDLES